MPKLFGFSIDDSDSKPDSVVSPVPQSNEDGVDYYIQSGFYGQYVDIEGVYRTEYDLIRRYREMALHPECDGAIEDVVNEAIVSDLYDSVKSTYLPTNAISIFWVALSRSSVIFFH